MALLRDSTKYVKEYVAAVIAASLLNLGVERLISALNYPIADVLLRLINTIIQQGFRDWILWLAPYRAPWQFHVTFAAEGIIAIVLGILVGLWVNSCEQRRPTHNP